ncbi:SDR family NAD(P)-dependent oxidoreductase [Streptomyces sp. NPDC051576]|uniref:SDR family NAD(P)-dependent oxidoreductase n=1 Tax=Streptomyces sp. NPDC051576 TaxID=3155803 RepID=UPI0034435C41
MTVTLVTGANRGIGLETARQLVQRGHTVYLGARDAGRGTAAAHSVGARPLLLDVTDDKSVAEAAAQVRDEVGHLNVLVNNAGVGGADKEAAHVTEADLRTVYDTNVFGVVRVIHAFLPLLQAACAPRVVNVSSGLGSFGITHDASRFESGVVNVAYNSSKSALNMITTQYAKALPTLRINAVDPGFTATEMNGHRGTQTVREGATAVVRLACADADSPTGGYFSAAGPLPW